MASQPAPDTDPLLRAPAGAGILTGGDARRRRLVEAKAAAVFGEWGYEEVLLPLFDHAEVFARGGGRWSERSSYRFTEGGDLLALRADFTTLVARAAATRLPDDVARLFYRGELVRRPAPGFGPSLLREVGLERFAGGVPADVEVLLVAFRALEEMGVRGALFTLGHAGFPLGLLDAALESDGSGGGTRRAEALRGLWRRDRGRIRRALGDGAAPLAGALDFVGGVEVLDAAGRRSLPDRARKALERLQAIAAALGDLGLGDRFRFDLAELRGFDYYTGLIFEIHAEGAGREIGGGGRYDDLLARFGDARPAVGFSLSVDRIAGILPDPAPSVAVPGTTGAPRETLEGVAGRFRAGRVAVRSAGAAANVNGRILPADAPVVSALDHGFFHGLAVYENLRTYDGVPLLFDDHLERLRGSAAVFGIPVAPSNREITDRLHATRRAAGGEGDSSLRITLTAGPDGGEPSLVILVRPLPPLPVDPEREGVGVLLTERVRAVPGGLPPEVKTTNLAGAWLAVRDARAVGAHEALVRNAAGEITEGATSNVFWVRDGTVVTAPLAGGLLPGITRALLFEALDEAGIPRREERMPMGRFVEADEAFLTSSSREVLPITWVVDLEGRRSDIGSGSPGPVTGAALAAYRKVAARRIERG